MKERPWIWIVIGFVIMIVSLATLVVIAVKNEPLDVPLEHHEHP
jgi:hypothetical protein